MKNKIILLIMHLILSLAFGFCYVYHRITMNEMFVSVISLVTASCWLGCALIDILDIIETRRKR